LYGPDFVVGVHHGNQDRVRRHGASHIIRVDTTESIYLQASNFRSQAFQKSARADDCRVLDLRRDDVRALRSPGEEDSF